MAKRTPPSLEDKAIGRRLQEIRAGREMSQRAVAELAGFSAGYLSMIENGERAVDKRSTLEALAAALRVAPSELTGAPYPSTDAAASEAHASIVSLRFALADVEMIDPPECELRPFPLLRTELDQVNALRQACDFVGLGRVLPGVVRDLHAHVHASSDAARRDALIGLVDCYEAARAASKHLGVPDLSQIAARHVRDATDALSGAEWSGLAAWSRAQAIGSTSRDRALALSTRAADELAGELDRPEVAEMYGSLHLVAALSAATLGRYGDAETHLGEAADTAARTVGTGTNFGHLYFGPGNVETWRVMVTVERGEGGKVGEIARAVPPESLPASDERRSSFYLDLGRGLATDKATRGQAVVALRRAKDIAPQKIRANPFARETVADLRRRVPRDSHTGRELRGLAHWMGISV